MRTAPLSLTQGAGATGANAEGAGIRGDRFTGPPSLQHQYDNPLLHLPLLLPLPNSSAGATPAATDKAALGNSDLLGSRLLGMLGLPPR